MQFTELAPPAVVGHSAPAGQAGDPGELCPHRPCAQAKWSPVPSFYGGGGRSVFFLKAFTCLMRPTHIVKGNPKSPDININHIFKNTFVAKSRLVLEPKTGYPDPAKLTHKTVMATTLNSLLGSTMNAGLLACEVGRGALPEGFFGGFI